MPVVSLRLHKQSDCPYKHLTWTTREGVRYKGLCDLSYSHLNNAIAYMQKRMVALARLGRPHQAMACELTLIALLDERAMRDNEPRNQAIKDYIDSGESPWGTMDYYPVLSKSTRARVSARRDQRQFAEDNAFKPDVWFDGHGGLMDQYGSLQ